eukprot:GFKZ01009150.1.p1 GENE.GFKZ01009150.1~~GFKZ01009150.1.p1  ORF type:complete len:278 (+),score=33.94 GFKZ01009150.1:48-881(+)
MTRHTQRLFTAPGRLLSAGWKQQRDSDVYANRAIQAGLRSRAAFKLDEINKKFGSFLRQGSYVVDLGASPGGFSKVAAGLINLESAVDRWNSLKQVDLGKEPRFPLRTMGGQQKKRRYGQLVCVDRQPMEQIPGAIFVHGDIADDTVHHKIIHGLNGKEADAVLSDMAPFTTGEKERDHLLIMELAGEALVVAQKVLRNGGIFCCKVFAGGEEKEFRDELEDCFVKVRTFKPAASRKVSREVYYVAQGFVPLHLREADRGEGFEGVHVRELVEQKGL